MFRSIISLRNKICSKRCIKTKELPKDSLTLEYLLDLEKYCKSHKLNAQIFYINGEK